MRKPSKAAHINNIVITGTSGFLGSTLLKNLDSNPRFQNILAIDRKTPPFKLKKAKWVSFDLIEGDADQKLAAIFEKHKTKTVVHAALLTQPIRNLEEAHQCRRVRPCSQADFGLDHRCLWGLSRQPQLFDRGTSGARESFKPFFERQSRGGRTVSEFPKKTPGQSGDCFKAGHHSGADCQ